MLRYLHIRQTCKATIYSYSFFFLHIFSNSNPFTYTVDNVKRALPKIPNHQQENGANDDDMGESDYQMAKDWSPKGLGEGGGGSSEDNKK